MSHTNEPVPPRQNHDPLHGVTLKALLEDLVERHGWEGLGHRIRINCFISDPSVNSSLKFLRKTPWARTKVENLYVADQRSARRKVERAKRRDEKRAQHLSEPIDEPTDDAPELG